MTSPSIFISWISTVPAAGDSARTNLEAADAFSRMNAPVAFWPTTLARVHAPSTVTEGPLWAKAELLSKATASRKGFVKLSMCKISDVNKYKSKTAAITGNFIAPVDKPARGEIDG